MTRINACNNCSGSGVVHGETCGACAGMVATTRAEGLAMACAIRDGEPQEDIQAGPNDTLDDIRTRSGHLYFNQDTYRVYRDINILLIVLDDAQQEIDYRARLVHQLEARIRVLTRALRDEHSCATLRSDGGCDGCRVSDVINADLVEVKEVNP